MKFIIPVLLLITMPVAPLLGAIGMVWLFLAAYDSYLNWKWGEH